MQNRGTCREVEDGIRYHHSDIRNSSVNNSELSGMIGTNEGRRSRTQDEPSTFIPKCV